MRLTYLTHVGSKREEVGKDRIRDIHNVGVATLGGSPSWDPAIHRATAKVSDQLPLRPLFPRPGLLIYRPSCTMPHRIWPKPSGSGSSLASLHTPPDTVAVFLQVRRRFNIEPPLVCITSPRHNTLPWGRGPQSVFCFLCAILSLERHRSV